MSNNADKSLRHLQDLKEYFNLDDMWTKLNPEKTGNTWCDAKNDPKSRIDYIFINNSFYYIPTDFKVGKIPGTHSNGIRMTDHRFLKLYYDIDKTKKGPGYWKLNVSYLENGNYKKGISDIVHNIDPSLSPLTTWELIKRNVREFSIKFAKTEQKSFKQKIKTTIFDLVASNEWVFRPIF